MNVETRFFHALVERRAVEVPRVGAADALRKYLGQKVFVSFRDPVGGGPKLGINPRSQYNTPNGIYAYPIQTAVRETGPIRVPFGGERPYIYVLRLASGAMILDLGDFDGGDWDRTREFLIRYQADGYRQALRNLPRLPSPRAVHQAIKDIDAWAVAASFQTPGGRLWNVTRMLAGGNPNRWNAIFREVLGVDGVYDPGHGIIHGNEPTQAVFFSARAVEVIELVDNREYQVVAAAQVPAEIHRFLKRLRTGHGTPDYNTASDLGEELAQRPQAEQNKVLLFLLSQAFAKWMQSYSHPGPMEGILHLIAVCRYKQADGSGQFPSDLQARVWILLCGAVETNITEWSLGRTLVRALKAVFGEQIAAPKTQEHLVMRIYRGIALLSPAIQLDLSSHRRSLELFLCPLAELLSSESREWLTSFLWTWFQQHVKDIRAKFHADDQRTDTLRSVRNTIMELANAGWWSRSQALTLNRELGIDGPVRPTEG